MFFTISTNVYCAPFKVNLFKEQIDSDPRKFYTIKIVSTEDNLIISKIITNRGNCEVYSPSEFLSHGKIASLKFSESENFQTTCQDLLEFTIYTNQGTFSYKN